MEASPSTSGASEPDGFPIKTLLYRRHLSGTPTDFSFSMYSDRTLIFVTQGSGAGTILQASQDAAFDGSTTFSTSVLLGRRDEPLLQLCARQVVEMAGSAGLRKPMVLGLCFKEHSMQVVREVCKAISEENIWS